MRVRKGTRGRGDGEKMQRRMRPFLDAEMRFDILLLFTTHLSVLGDVAALGVEELERRVHFGVVHD